MKYFISYIDEEFLEAFFNLKPTDMEADGEEVEIWRHWKNFLQNKTDIDYTGKINFVDLAYESLMTQIFNDRLQGDNYLQINSGKLEKTSAKELVTEATKPTFIFRNNLQNPELTEANTGICCITGATFYEKWQHYFKPRSFAVSKNPINNRLEKWSDLFFTYRYPSNAFVIVDNYVLSYEPNIKHNLLRLLKEVLYTSKFVKTEIDMIIVCENFYKEIDDREVGIDKLYKEITGYLRNASFLNVNLCIVKAKYHDRIILSNNFVITSGNSFNYFRYDGTTALPENTTLKLTPLTCDYSSIETYKAQLSNIIDQSTNFKGTKKNRLLKLFS